MDMESISSVNSNYSSTESVKAKSAPVESAHTAVCFRGFFCSCENGI